MTCSNAKVHKLIIDSRSRNFEDDPNNYRIDLPEMFSNVKSIELKGAAIPRTEYNINSSNKNLDFSVGTWISKITYIPTDGDSFGVGSNGVHSISISPPVHSFGMGNASASTSTDQTFSGVRAVPVVATVTISGGSVSSISITNSGLGYSNSSKITATVIDNTIGLRLTNFKIDVGFKYTAKMREGQYNIGGNPQFTREFTDPTATGGALAYPQSWVPSAFIAELEAAMSFAILDIDNSTEYPNASDVISTVGLPGSADVINLTAAVPAISSNTISAFIHERRSWTDTQWAVAASGLRDYPLPFKISIVSQYPDIRTQSDPAITQSKPEHYGTNSCLFNRLQITNCLVIRADGTGGQAPPDPSTWTAAGGTNYVFYDFAGWGYEVVKFFSGFPGTNGAVYICKLRTPVTGAGIESAQFWADYPWPGLTSGSMYQTTGTSNTNGPQILGATLMTGTGTPFTLSFETFELLFASGVSNFTNSSSLIGFDNIDYGSTWGLKKITTKPTLTATQYLHRTINGGGTTLYKVSIPRGLSYRTVNDWYLHGDAEYILVSLEGLPDANYQITSDTNTNINGEFACLVFDSPTATVLQGMSSGPSITPWYSGKQNTNENMPSFINYSGQAAAGTQILTGGVGTTNAFSSSVGGSMKAVSGSTLYGPQIIKFAKPVRNVGGFRIKFSKFNKNVIESKELYDFHGKEHLLIFEVITQICETEIS